MGNELRPGRYRHYKGRDYQLLYTATHSETLEEMVVDRALYGEGSLWLRPASMWYETIKLEGQTLQRFSYMEDEKSGGSMNTEIITQNGVQVAVVSSAELLIYDVQSALDFAMTVQYDTGCHRIALSKKHIAEDFFTLSTRLAGDVLQKYINYRVKLAIIGDFSGYTSRSLRSFLYESNRGKDVFFVTTQEEAVTRLAAAPE
jgi:hypothetical protein